MENISTVLLELWWLKCRIQQSNVGVFAERTAGYQENNPLFCNGCPESPLWPHFQVPPVDKGSPGIKLFDSQVRRISNRQTNGVYRSMRGHSNPLRPCTSNAHASTIVPSDTHAPNNWPKNPNSARACLCASACIHRPGILEWEITGYVKSWRQWGSVGCSAASFPHTPSVDWLR